MKRRLDDIEKEKRKIALYLLWILILFAALSMMIGCRTIYVEKPEYHEVHDTIIKKEFVDKEVIKEVTIRDSSSFRQEHDTIKIEHWHWERDYRYEKALQAKIDSLTQLKRDSIPYPVEVVKEVEKPLKQWQKGLIWWGIIVTLGLFLYVYLRIRFHR